MNVKPTRNKVIICLLVAALMEIALVVAIFLTMRPVCDPNVVGIAACGYGFNASKVLWRASIGGLYYSFAAFLATYLIYSLFEKK